MRIAPPQLGKPWMAREVRLHASARRLSLAGCILILVAIGCGKKPPDMGQVDGTVRVKGKPQGRLVVRFMPEPEKGKSLSITATGTTDAQGKYSLQHDFEGKSAPRAQVGWHRVVIEDTSRAPTPQGQTPPPPLVPLEYSSPGTTPLRHEVKAGTQTIDLDVGK